MKEIKARDYLFDNMKAVLILLVVFGHICFSNRGIPALAGITNMIYTFHMPLFIFISGYFSKSVRTLKPNTVLHLLVPYIIIELLNYVYTYSTGLGEGKLNLLTPTYQNWYLLALFFWRLITPSFQYLSRNQALILAFILALGVGFINQFTNFLALYRVFYFLPFFVMGYFCQDLSLLLDRFSKYRKLLVAGLMLIMAAIFTLSFLKVKIATILLYAYLPVTGYDHHLQYFAVRAVAMLSSVFLCISVCYLIPRHKTWLSAYGENTLYVFLFHMFIVWAVNPYFMPYKPVLTEALLLLLSFAITWLLSQKFISRILRPILYPDYLLSLLKPSKK